jgi:hypothetical protein
LRLLVLAPLFAIVLAGCSTLPSAARLPVRFLSGKSIDETYSIVWDVPRARSEVDVVRRTTAIPSINSNLLHGELALHESPGVVAISGGRFLGLSDLCATAGHGESVLSNEGMIVVGQESAVPFWVEIPPDRSEGGSSASIRFRTVVVDSERNELLSVDGTHDWHSLTKNVRARVKEYRQADGLLRVKCELECADARQFNAWPSAPMSVRLPFVMQTSLTPAKGNDIVPKLAVGAARRRLFGPTVIPFEMAVRWDGRDALPMLEFRIALAGHVDVVDQDIALGSAARPAPRSAPLPFDFLSRSPI